MVAGPSPASAGRKVLHRLAVHVMGKRRYDETGHFGLRTAPNGIATPAFGDEPEVLRLSTASLIRERGAQCTSVPVDGRTLSELAAFAGTDLDPSFSVGHETPELGDPDAPLEFPSADAQAFAEWYGLGAEVLDEVLTALAPGLGTATVQLWPEHLDLATSVVWAEGAGCNLGFSPGDSWLDEPYVYVGPWGGQRPGDPAFWNAPFGAVQRRSDLERHGDLALLCRSFLQSGLTRLLAG